MADFLTVRTNFGPTADAYAQVGKAIPSLLRSASARIRENIRGILLESLYYAVDQAGSGFPPQYADHLAEGVLHLATLIEAAGNELLVSVADPSSLGDYGDLSRGFHYHALIGDIPDSMFAVTNAQKVELPYTGQSLLNDKGKRLAFWEQLVDGLPVAVQLKGHIHFVQTGGRYDETIDARVAYWRSASVYPEWLILEYGAEDHPVVQPTHFTQLLQARIETYMEEVVTEIADGIADTLSSINVGVGSSGIPYSVNTGRFERYIK